MTLCEWVEKNEIRVQDLAASLGVTRAAAYRWINRESSPSLETAVKIHDLTFGAVGFKDLLATQKNQKQAA
jgi:predicted transcriptional regulator